MNTAWGELLPLLLLLGHPGSSNASESAGDSGLPVSFDASLSALVGESVRVSLAHHVDNAATLVGTLDRVGSDFIVLRDVLASSVSLGFRDHVAIPMANLVGIDRLPFLDRLLPLMGHVASHSS